LIPDSRIAVGLVLPCTAYRVRLVFSLSLERQTLFDTVCNISFYQEIILQRLHSLERGRGGDCPKVALLTFPFTNWLIRLKVEISYQTNRPRNDPLSQHESVLHAEWTGTHSYPLLIGFRVFHPWKMQRSMEPMTIERAAAGQTLAPFRPLICWWQIGRYDVIDEGLCVLVGHHIRGRLQSYSRIRVR
jgi:hypothetical protein